MQMPSGWYAIATERELSTRKMNALRRFGQDWIVRKTKKGDWIAQLDSCPHRSVKLSLGQLNDDCVSCPFHGFRFDETGTCTWVPEIKRDAPGLKLKTFPLRLAHGFVWFPMGSPQTEIPWFEELNKDFSYSWSTHRWKKHFTRCVENQLDYAHLPYVHHNNIGSGFDPSISAAFEIDDRRIKVTLSQNPKQNSYFEFRFGNIWKLNISALMKQTIAFVPVDEHETRIYLRTYHRFTRIPILRSIVAWLLAPFNSVVLYQDHRVVMTQDPNNSLAAQSEVLFPSDRAIRAFRNWMQSSERSEAKAIRHADTRSS